VLPEGALSRAGVGLGGGAPGVPGLSADRAEAEVAGASRLITGYLERTPRGIRISATEEDLGTHATVRMLSAEAPEPLPAIERLAHEFSSRAAAPPTSDPQALKLYATALDQARPGDSAGLWQAVRLAPRFGQAWIALVDAVSLSGDRAGALHIADEALREKLDPYDTASLQLQKAALENDKTARLAALRRMTDLSPGDLPLLSLLAENETAAGRFADSAGDFRKLRERAPDDRQAWNQLGYTLAWAGDLPGALKALNEYAARWPADPNPLDSRGDVEYMFGKFGDAAADYLKANEKQPQFLNGGELLKAAWAQFRAGDRKKAGASFAAFQAARKKAGGPDTAPFEADWLFRTGRIPEALALLRKRVRSAPPAAASVLLSQLILDDLISGDRAAASKDMAAGAARPGINLGGVTRFAALPSASAEEWRNRADTMLKGAGAAREVALGVALLLDGRKAAALPVWESVASQASGTDFFVRAVVAKLKGEKPHPELVPDATSVNELRALAD
jgi:tetratricopeptide (TPR) repeat protein